MGKLLMLREDDALRIEALKKRMRARTKVDIVRSALDLLEASADRAERIERWRRVARLVAGESRRVLKEFQSVSRLRRLVK